MSITPKEREKWRAECQKRSGPDSLGNRPDQDAARILRLLDALERAELQRDTATEVVENEQGRVAMYVGKYETALREGEASAQRAELAARERDWLAARLAEAHAGSAPESAGRRDSPEHWLEQARKAAASG